MRLQAAWPAAGPPDTGRKSGQNPRCGRSAGYPADGPSRGKFSLPPRRSARSPQGHADHLARSNKFCGGLYRIFVGFRCQKSCFHQFTLPFMISMVFFFHFGNDAAGSVRFSPSFPQKTSLARRYRGQNNGLRSRCRFPQAASPARTICTSALSSSCPETAVCSPQETRRYPEQVKSHHFLTQKSSFYCKDL